MAPPPPPPMPSWFPFGSKKPKRRLSFSSFAQPQHHHDDDDELNSMASPLPPPPNTVPPGAHMRRNNSYSSSSTVTSAPERLTFVTDSEKYDDIPQEMTRMHVNGKGEKRLVRGNTMTGISKGLNKSSKKGKDKQQRQPTPSIEQSMLSPLPIERSVSDPPPPTPAKEEKASAIKRSNTKKSGWGSGFGYGWGVGKQAQFADDLKEENYLAGEKEESPAPEYHTRTPTRSNSKSSGGSGPPVIPPDPPSRSNSYRSSPLASAGPSRSNTRNTTSSRQSPPTRTNTGKSSAHGPYGGPVHRTDSSSTLIGSAYERKLNAPDNTPHLTSTSNQIAGLRALMAIEKENIDFYLVPREDAHGNEWVAPSDKRLEYISGFTGSAGMAIIGRDAGCWLCTDSRYWIQASIECDENWVLVKVGAGGHHASWVDFLMSLITPNASMRIGVDGRMVAYSIILSLMSKLDHTTRIVYTTQNLVDLVWGRDKPPKSIEPLYMHPMEFAGQHSSQKLQSIGEWINSTPPDVPSYNRGKELAKKDLNVGTLMANMNAIAWILNLRGSDLPFNPLFHSYLFVSSSADGILFVEPSKVSDEVRQYLAGLGITVRPYGDLWNFIRKREWGEGRLIISPSTSYTIYLVLSHYRVTISPSPSSLHQHPLPSYAENLSSIKNATEIEGFRRAYLRDGAAFVKFLSWLEDKFAKGYEITEWEAAQRFTEFRRKSRNFMGLAYPAISASGGNAAIPHYVPSKGSSKSINKKLPYLNDSGGQYLDGTTDTTRTWLFAPRPSPEVAEEVIEAYTRVLQGHIAIDSVVFPAGTSGKRLDVLGRRGLWKEGREYLHGTGHGTGSFLSVHEGTHSFSSDDPLMPGMLITNEPGYYSPSRFGIRLESTLVVRQLKPSHAPGGETWLGFERLTCVPIQTRMVKVELLTREEKTWIKEHNQKCLDKLQPLLLRDGEGGGGGQNGDVDRDRARKALAWLKRECARGIGVAREGPGGLVVDWD